MSPLQQACYKYNRSISLYETIPSSTLCSSLPMLHHAKICKRTQEGSTHETTYAPPAIVLPHPLHVQIPTECRLTVCFPQNVQVYRACWVISIFFTCFRSEAPYLFRNTSRSVLPAHLYFKCNMCSLLCFSDADCADIAGRDGDGAGLAG